MLIGDRQKFALFQTFLSTHCKVHCLYQDSLDSFGNFLVLLLKPKELLRNISMLLLEYKLCLELLQFSFILVTLITMHNKLTFRLNFVLGRRLSLDNLPIRLIQSLFFLDQRFCCLLN